MIEDKKSVPKRRFKEFNNAGDWEQRKLRELGESFEYGLNAAAMEFDGEHKYIRITDIDDSSRLFLDSDLTSPNIDLSNADNYKLKYGDILFARTGASVGKSYIYRDYDGLVYYAGFLIRARIKKEFDPEFVFYNTLTNEYNQYIRITSQRSGQPGVNAQEYAEYEIKIPIYEEQVKIGAFMRQLDNLITLHQRKLEKIKNQKAAYLWEMFPQEGECVPKRRFAGFTEPWEQRKLRELINFIVDNRGKNPSYYCTEGIPVIDNYMIKNNEYPNLSEANRFIDEYLFENFIRKYNEKDDILITLVGNGIGNIALFPSTKSVIIQNTIGLRTDSNKRFLYYNLQSENKKIVLLDRGMAQPSIRQDELLDVNLFVPNRDEQDQISEFFTNLDNLITLHQRKLEKLQNVKKAFLNEMFI